MEKEYFHVIGISLSFNDQFFVEKDVPLGQCFSCTMIHDADAILQQESIDC